MGLYSFFDPRVISPCSSDSLFNHDSRSQRASTLCQLSQQRGEETLCCCLSLSDWSTTGPSQCLVPLTPPIPFCFRFHPSGMPVVLLLVLPAFTAVLLCLDGRSFTLTTVKYALALFPLWVAILPKLLHQPIDQQQYTYKDLASPHSRPGSEYLSRLYESFDSLMGRIIHCCFNLCFTYCWLWSSFSFLCLERIWIFWFLKCLVCPLSF